ncbi:MAG: hypothetical protein V3V78_05340, partial [Candidatus Woesearchaeota archaeon]
MTKILDTGLDIPENLLIQGGVFVPHLVAPPLVGFTKRLEEMVPGYGLEMGMVFYGDKGDGGRVVMNRTHIFERAESLVKNSDIIHEQIKRWKRLVKEFYDFIEKLEKEGIKDLKNDYQTFFKLYIDEYAVALLSEYFIEYIDEYLDRIKKTLAGDKNLVNELAFPNRKSFINDEEENLLQISLKLSKIKNKKIESVKKEHSGIYEDIVKHQKEFFWVESNYKYTEP